MMRDMGGDRKGVGDEEGKKEGVKGMEKKY